MLLQYIERDVKSEHLPRMCSAASNLVMSLDFNPIHCATMLCLFGQTQNGSEANHFITFSSNAMSSATGNYVVVPKRCGQNEGPGGRKEERTRNKPSFAP